jgi:site-specific recombinase XerD
MGLAKEATMIDGCRVRVTGPLAAYVEGFREDLAAQGYTVQPRDRNLRTLAHVSRWMASVGVSVGELTPDRLEEFLEVRRREGYHHALSMRAVMPLMEYLRRLGVVPDQEVALAAGVLEVVVEDYARYLASERGLTPAVVNKYSRFAHAFLASLDEDGGFTVSELSAASVTDYVMRECRGRPAGSARHLVTVLRSLLGFLFLAGHTADELAPVVPGVAYWGAGSLPRALRPDAVAALMASCDETTLVGRRDRAILVLLARLGLRAGEVAALELADLDWRAGEVVLHNAKARRRERLPLPVDVGEAVVAYLRRGRPRVACRKVFLRLNAPIVGLTPPAVTAIVYRACRRAGLPEAGAHRLRHSVATAMLAGGGTMAEVGQVLRHVRRETTRIYAKVDRRALRDLALPWPGGAA